jgi:hypothetical protein
MAMQVNVIMEIRAVIVSFLIKGHATAQAVSRRLPTVMDIVALWQVFSEYFGFP